MEELDLIDLNYLIIYEMSAHDRIKIVKRGIKASVAKRITASEARANRTSGLKASPVTTAGRRRSRLSDAVQHEP